MRKLSIPENDPAIKIGVGKNVRKSDNSLAEMEESVESLKKQESASTPVPQVKINVGEPQISIGDSPTKPGVGLSDDILTKIETSVVPEMVPLMRKKTIVIQNMDA